MYKHNIQMESNGLGETLFSENIETMQSHYYEILESRAPQPCVVYILFEHYR